MKKSVVFACAVLLGMLVFSTTPTTHGEGWEFWPSTKELIGAFLAFVLLVSAAVALVVGAALSLFKNCAYRRERRPRLMAL